MCLSPFLAPFKFNKYLFIGYSSEEREPQGPPWGRGLGFTHSRPALSPDKPVSISRYQSTLGKYWTGKFPYHLLFFLSDAKCLIVLIICKNKGG